jgi:hypothetical protein
LIPPFIQPFIPNSSHPSSNLCPPFITLQSNLNPLVFPPLSFCPDFIQLLSTLYPAYIQPPSVLYPPFIHLIPLPSCSPSLYQPSILFHPLSNFYPFFIHPLSNLCPFAHPLSSLYQPLLDPAFIRSLFALYPAFIHLLSDLLSIPTFHPPSIHLYPPFIPLRRKICWNITIRTLVQPIQPHLRFAAAKDNNSIITHAAAAARNLDAASPLRSAKTCLQNTISQRQQPQRKSRMDTLVTQRVQIEADSVLKRRWLEPSRTGEPTFLRTGAYVYPKTQCFVQIRTFKSNPFVAVAMRSAYHGLRNTIELQRMTLL